jgi:hypothetical protein
MEGSVQWEDRIGRRIKLRDVNILLAVVQCGSMAAGLLPLVINRLCLQHPRLDFHVTNAASGPAL